jgi:hypothetical protein
MPGCSFPAGQAEGRRSVGSAALAIRLLLSYALVLCFAARYGRDFVEALLPVFQAVIVLLDVHYRILSLTISTEGADTVVRLMITLAQPIFLNGHLIMPDPRGWATVTTTIGTVLQIPLISLGLIFAWPVRCLGEFLARLGIGLALLSIAMLLDTPFSLWACLWDLHVHAFDPGRFSPLLIWQRSLMGGGRLAIGVALGVASIALSQRRFWRALSTPLVPNV